MGGSPVLGSVIWATVSDRNGQNRKCRPLLVIEPLPSTKGAVYCCLAISTDPTTDPADPTIEIPWDKDSGDITGLYQFSRTVLLWHVQVDPGDIEDHTGRITQTQFNEIKRRRQFSLDFPSGRK